MTHDYLSDWDAVMSESRGLSKAAPDVFRAFGGLHKAAMEDGALDKKTKELMTVAIGIAIRCDGCILSHVRAALRAGATREEIVEVVGVAVMMGGGPSSVYGAKAIEMTDQLLSQMAASRTPSIATDDLEKSEITAAG